MHTDDTNYTEKLSSSPLNRAKRSARKTSFRRLQDKLKKLGCKMVITSIPLEGEDFLAVGILTEDRQNGLLMSRQAELIPGPVICSAVLLGALLKDLPLESRSSTSFCGSLHSEKR